VSFWWEIAAELDGKTMLSASRLKNELADKKTDLSGIKQDLERQKQWLEQRRQLVSSARSEKTNALAQVSAEVAGLEKHIKDLEAESRRLTAALRSRVSTSTGAVSRAGFIWPINGRVTSPYGSRRGGFHPGIDIDGNTGDPIKASKSGQIVGVACGSGYGICTVIDHGGGVATLYAHMSRKAVSGGSVQQGQVIGYVGCTGSCTGSHLHFEVRVNGSPQNPRNFLP
jgi:murein DD-endopeptidase MepM/ murein hydrolase activator NlpD